MIRGGFHMREVVTVFALTFLLHVNAATNNKNNNQQVINEINKMENMMKTLKTPPELVEGLLKQLEGHCQTNRTIEKTLIDDAQKCVEQHLNATKVADDMRAAVPEGKMDMVFHDLCLKWPKINGCMKDMYVIVTDCWDKGTKVKTFVNEVVNFFCGEDKGGERIALFFAEGGLDCLQSRGDDLKRCVESKQDLIDVNADLDINEIGSQKIKIPKTDDICKNVDELYSCASVELRKCNDTTPENLMTAMLKHVGTALDCKVTESQSRQSSNTAFASMISLESLIFAGLIGLLA